MLIKIRDICEISTGVYVKTQRVGDVFYFQARDFDKYKNLDENIKPVVLSHSIKEKHFLQFGDVIIAAKGLDHFAFTYKDQIKPAVASSMFIVLKKIDENKVLPNFISWYINHPKIQAFLIVSSKGSGIPSINKNTIGDIKINLPSIKKQRLIIAINDKKKREKQLKEQIDDLKETLLDQQLINLVKN